MNRRHQGLTILEVLIAISLSVIILLVMGQLMDIITDLRYRLGRSSTEEEEVRSSLQILAAETRSLGPADNGSYPIVAASSTVFIFYSDVDGDGSTERVRYELATSTLERGIIEPSGDPVHYVTSTESARAFVSAMAVDQSHFRYFGAAATSTLEPLGEPVDIAQIRALELTIMVNVSTSTDPQFRRFTQFITSRRLRFP